MATPQPSFWWLASLKKPCRFPSLAVGWALHVTLSLSMEDRGWSNRTIENKDIVFIPGFVGDYSACKFCEGSLWVSGQEGSDL